MPGSSGYRPGDFTRPADTDDLIGRSSRDCRRSSSRSGVTMRSRLDSGRTRRCGRGRPAVRRPRSPASQRSGEIGGYDTHVASPAAARDESGRSRRRHAAAVRPATRGRRSAASPAGTGTARPDTRARPATESSSVVRIRGTRRKSPRIRPPTARADRSTSRDCAALVDALDRRLRDPRAASARPRAR